MGYENEHKTQTGDIMGGSGGGMMAGLLAMIILIVVVLWLLFKDGHRGERDGGYPYMHPGMYPQFEGGRKDRDWVPDEPTYKVDRHLTEEICDTDKDVWKTSCKTQKTVMEENEKTRALITHNQERADDREYQKMLYEGVKKDGIIRELEIGRETDRKYDCLTRDIDKLSCETPKRPPYWAQGYVDDGYSIPPRRKHSEPCYG